MTAIRHVYAAKVDARLREGTKISGFRFIYVHDKKSLPGHDIIKR